jgi:hypothetical protein
MKDEGGRIYLPQKIFFWTLTFAPPARAGENADFADKSVPILKCTEDRGV